MKKILIEWLLKRDDLVVLDKQRFMFLLGQVYEKKVHPLDVFLEFGSGQQINDLYKKAAKLGLTESENQRTWN